MRERSRWHDDSLSGCYNLATIIKKQPKDIQENCVDHKPVKCAEKILVQAFIVEIAEPGRVQPFVFESHTANVIGRGCPFFHI